MVNIFIEGKDKNVPESAFLRAILKHIGVSSDKYDICHTNGYKNLLDSENAETNYEIMRANTDVGGKNIVVFDADTKNNEGGYTLRRGELLKKRDELGLEFELFLWPDNKNDGDVEVLMESIARRDLYPEFFDCFSKFECCISKRKDVKGNSFYKTPNRKSKLHTYFHSLPISKRKKSGFGKGDWRWEDHDIWNLDSVSLNPIKEFLKKYLL